MLSFDKIRRHRGHTYVVVAFFLLAFFASVFLFGRDTIRWKIGPGKLEHVLKKGAMANRTVILVTLSEAWAKPNSIFDVFLESFRIGEQTRPLMKHLVIVAIDDKAMARCQELHLHCYLLNIEDMDPSDSEKRFMSKDYVALIWGRLRFFGKVLELGYNFLLTDVDIVWFRSPFGHLYPNADISVSCDNFNGHPSDPANRPNVGFIFVKSNNRTIDFYSKWYQTRSLYPHKLTQFAFKELKKGEYLKKLGLKIRYLNTDEFGGFCNHGNDMNKLRTLHANCCVGLDRKIHDLKIILQVWKKFSNLPPDGKVKGLPWKAPIKCRM